MPTEWSIGYSIESFGGFCGYVCGCLPHCTSSNADPTSRPLSSQGQLVQFSLYYPLHHGGFHLCWLVSNTAHCLRLSGTPARAHQIVICTVHPPGLMIGLVDLLSRCSVNHNEWSLCQGVVDRVVLVLGTRVAWLMCTSLQPTRFHCLGPGDPSTRTWTLRSRLHFKWTGHTT